MLNGKVLLKAENLEAGYKGHTILRDVSFSLETGEVLIIIGQNGSGKSTLLKTLSGLLPKKSGRVYIQENLQETIEPETLIKKGVSYFMQGGLIMPALTVKEHLELAAALNENKKQSIEEVLSEFPKLKGLENRRAGNLSGGERQMLSLAILQLQRTKIWLLDEPTAGLSPAMVDFTADFLHKKNTEGVTMLIVEHNMEVAFKLAANIIVTKQESVTRKFARNEFLNSDFLDNVVYN